MECRVWSSRCRGLWVFRVWGCGFTSLGFKSLGNLEVSGLWWRDPRFRAIAPLK